ncbi:MAG: N-acetylmuramoyl-L-alanine amidase [Jaaginema sp. PMC 1079.18]|nr:N-acetylmuramoyl-L-alanine amidase [Jaaginema sp. PMC 1080.18]MEC4851043.1 N-acetylmuramoyl-L-alanine amidase [Jaaginema sp. PMC 1079.18]MEC4868625.1 N-acetylmuramoyl-L-alanine amidase [Jaaginema sp. PMC 1078.18]
MSKATEFILIGAIASSSLIINLTPVQAESSLQVVYPPPEHQTTATQIFIIGSAPPTGTVTINGNSIDRSPSGYFAPSVPLNLGENHITVRYNNQTLTYKVTRISPQTQLPSDEILLRNSVTPLVDIARMPEDRVCFSAIAAENAQVSVNLNNRTLPLNPQTNLAELPPNNAVLNNSNEPIPIIFNPYQNCLNAADLPQNTQPVYQVSQGDRTVTQPASGAIAILNPNQLQVIEVTANPGVARTGPSTDYSRLTPLPQGTRAQVIGSEGEWLRLDYGAWIKMGETRTLPGATPPQAIIRSISARPQANATEIVFPLTVPVPIAVQQGDATFTLTLYNAIAQTDTIWLDDDPLIRRLDWQQIEPERLQYTFHLKNNQQWGYDLRYEGTSLILTLRHPPQANLTSPSPLAGTTILLDPGHGGDELGSRSPTGYPEKAVNLTVSQLLQAELEQRGATVYMTRTTDTDVSLADRMAAIDRVRPTLALSVHYNALPDGGDAENTAGVGMFWYNPQAHDLAVFLHNYIVETLDRPSYGVFWNNLALTRPHAAPSILMELGFMINPSEFEWIANPNEQQRLAVAIADGITEWLGGKLEE